MATITSVGSGNWSAAGTWDAGVPADNDTVVIAAGHAVTFDVDQSGFANGIAGLTITGHVAAAFWFTASQSTYVEWPNAALATVAPGGLAMLTPTGTAWMNI